MNNLKAIPAGRRHKSTEEALAESGFANTPFAEDIRTSTLPQMKIDSRRLLLRGGTILSMDPAIGDFVAGDVLIEGGNIAAVDAIIDAEATIVDASNMIVMPGLVDAHRHLWSSMFRRAIPNADGQVYSNFANALIPVLTEQDIFAATNLSDISALQSGITTLLDHCHVSKSSEIMDAAIEAHRTSGIRAVFSYAPPRAGPSAPQHPGDLERIIGRYFQSDQQLLTLRLGTRLISENYALARRMGLGITSDGVFGVQTPLRPYSSASRLMEMWRAGELGPDVTLIHGTGFEDDVLQAIAESGTHLVLAPTSDSTLRGLGDSVPPIQGVLDYGLTYRTGISVDIEISLSTDLFAQMRGIFTIQRVLANQRWAKGDTKAPENLTVRDVLFMATAGGAAASGVGHKVGTLTPGKEADIVMINANDIITGPLNNAVGTVVIGAGVDNVDTVIVRGQIRKWRGELVGVDERAIVQAARDSRDRIAGTTALWNMDNIIA